MAPIVSLRPVVAVHEAVLEAQVGVLRQEEVQHLRVGVAHAPRVHVEILELERWNPLAGRQPRRPIIPAVF